VLDTVTEPLTVFLEPAVTDKESVVADTVSVGDVVTPDWLTLALAPPAETAPLREDDDPFAATRNEKLPGPVRAEPSARVIHDAFAEGVHAQPAVVETFTVKLPPLLGALTAVGLSE
jgi:hypothetical protein